MRLGNEAPDEGVKFDLSIDSGTAVIDTSLEKTFVYDLTLANPRRPFENNSKGRTSLQKEFGASKPTLEHWNAGAKIWLTSWGDEDQPSEVKESSAKDVAVNFVDVVYSPTQRKVSQKYQLELRFRCPKLIARIR